MAQIFLTKRELEGDYEFVQMRPGTAVDSFADITEALFREHFPGLWNIQQIARNSDTTSPMIFALSQDQIDKLEIWGIHIPYAPEDALDTVATYAAQIATE